MAKPIEKDGKFYRLRRGKLVEIPEKWLGSVTSRQTINKRPSKQIHKLRKLMKYPYNKRRKQQEQEGRVEIRDQIESESETDAPSQIMARAPESPERGLTMSKKRVIVLSGLPGSGKSTWAKEKLGKLASGRVPNDIYPPGTIRAHENGILISADLFFMKEDSEGKEEYVFSPEKIGEAHASCFRNFIWAMEESHRGSTKSLDLIIIDNTNLSTEEIAPYMLGAAAFGYESEIFSILPFDHDLLQTRRGNLINFLHSQTKHGVPKETLEKQLKVLEGRKLPPWWKETRIPLHSLMLVDA